MINIKSLKCLSLRRLARFSGGHQIKEYDWRDDPKQNDDLYIDQRSNKANPAEYTTPYSAPAETW